jgi:hypothetical protein
MAQGSSDSELGLGGADRTHGTVCTDQETHSDGRGGVQCLGLQTLGFCCGHTQAGLAAAIQRHDCSPRPGSVVEAA